MSNSILSKLRKLQTMPVSELRGRAVERAHRVVERFDYLRGGRHRAREEDLTRVAESLRPRALNLVPGCHASDLEFLAHEASPLFDQLRRETGRHLEAYATGRYPLLGRAVDLRGEIDWHRDPGLDFSWPRRFYADLDLGQTAGRVDVKYVWELNRHQYLVELARGWLLNEDQTCAERARSLILDWIRENRYYEGINWTSALEVAVRSISWLWTIAGLANWSGWEEEDSRVVASSLIDHAHYLQHHLSFYSSPYNHLMGEATALLLLSQWLEGLPAARDWDRLGRHILAQYGPTQFYEDGFCVEQATGYHFFTVGFLMMAIEAARKSPTALDDLEPIVQRACRAGAAFVQPDGRWPAIGDVDSARSIPVLPKDYWDFRSLCSLAGALFEDPSSKAVGASPGAELFWLLGRAGMDAWHRVEATTATQHRVFHDSGYAVARQSPSKTSDWFLFDAGPLAGGLSHGATPSTAHGHADALQVLYAEGGVVRLADPGMPYYFGAEKWVDAFRSTEAHNSLRVDGTVQARTAGRLAWSHVVKTPQFDANLTDQAWLARGRIEWDERVVVERFVLALPGEGLRIVDWVEAERPRQAQWFWQLPEASISTRKVLAAQHGNTDAQKIEGPDFVLMTWSDAGPAEVSVENSDTASPAAWQSIGYGETHPGQRVSFSRAIRGSNLSATFLGRRAAPFDVTVRGQRLACGWDAPLSSSGGDSYRDADAEIVWRVYHEDKVRTFVAGPAALHPGPDWTALRGEGKWPAMFTSLVMKPVA